MRAVPLGTGCRCAVKIWALKDDLATRIGIESQILIMDPQIALYRGTGIAGLASEGNDRGLAAGK